MVREKLGSGAWECAVALGYEVSARVSGNVFRNYTCTYGGVRLSVHSSKLFARMTLLQSTDGNLSMQCYHKLHTRANLGVCLHIPAAVVVITANRLR